MLSNKEKELVLKLKKLPNSYPEKAEKLAEDAIIVIVLFAKERNNIDDIIRIVDESSTLDYALNEIFKDEYVEIVDDDEYDEEDE